MEISIKSGVYKLIGNDIRIYIGSSVNLKRRKQKHFDNLKRRIHHNTILQAYYNEFGKDSLTFEVLEYVEDVSQLKDREQFWIDSFDFKDLFNIFPNAKSPLGIKYSEERKLEISRRSLGRSCSDETKLKIGIANKDRIFSTEHRDKLSKAHKGKSLSEEHKIKISNKKKGESKTNETKEKMSKARIGIVFSEEHKRNISDKNKGRKQDLVKCPHCPKIGGISAMKRLHFDKCKYLDK